MSTALTVLREELGQQLGMMILIPAASFDAVATGSITSSDILRNSNWGGGQFKNWIIFRPGAATSADFCRYAGLLTNTTGLLAHTGANYADTTKTNEVVELWKPGARPDLELLASLNRVLEFEYLTTMLALSHVGTADGDMALSTDSNWTDVGTPTTSVKITTAGITPWGQRSYNLVGDAVNEGTRHAGMRVTQGRTVSMFTIATASIGTASFQPYDITNSAAFGTAVTHSELEPQLMAQQNISIPATCKVASANMLGTTNPSNIAWTQLWQYAMDNLEVRLPAGVTESFMAPRILQAVPRVSTGTGLYDANSLDMIPLVEGLDYWLMINHADSEAYKVRFAQILPTTGGHPYAWPLFVEARIPQSNLVTLSAEGDVVSVPKHNLLPRWKIDCLETIWNGAAAPRHPDWKNQIDLAKMQLLKATNSRPAESIAPATPYWAPRLGAR